MPPKSEQKPLGRPHLIRKFKKIPWHLFKVEKALSHRTSH